MREKDVISVLIISSDHNLWSRMLSEQSWNYRIVSSVEKAKVILRKIDSLVLVFDVSCGQFECADLELLNEAGVGRSVRTIAYLDKQQKLGLSSEAFRVVCRCCVDYYTSPLPKEMIIRTLGHQIGMLAFDTRLPEPQTNAKASSEQDYTFIIGESQPVAKLKKQVRKVGPTDVNTLICGESGTGKELVARALHDSSTRSSAAFIAVNCGALNEQLVHSELFGHEKGAFTGANQNRVGKIAMAHQGTLFLDEIGDLPLPQQANLLRFLQEGTIDVLGSDAPVKVDVRVLAATHIDLERAVRDGRFRQDLYFRLNVLRVHVPALRERSEDILILAEHFRHKFATEYNCDVVGYDESAKQRLLDYAWPGNVRELINIVKRAVLMNELGTIVAQDLDIQSTSVTPYLVSENQCDNLVMALDQHEGNVLKAARFLGISRATAYRMIERYDLKSVVEKARGQLGLAR